MKSKLEANRLELFDEQGNNLTELIGKGFGFSLKHLYVEMGARLEILAL